MLEVGLKRWPDDPNGGEHEIVGVHVSLADSDDRFSIDFQTESGRTLRVKMPVVELERLARCLLDAAAERRLHGDV
jgi:hypothetical protein